jgi:hypothetical protein
MNPLCYMCQKSLVLLNGYRYFCSDCDVFFNQNSDGSDGWWAREIGDHKATYDIWMKQSDQRVIVWGVELTDRDRKRWTISDLPPMPFNITLEKLRLYLTFI